MANNYQVNAFYSGPGGYGWSEIYYIQAADPGAAATAYASLETLRLAVLPDTHETVYARVSDVAIMKDSTPVDGIYPKVGTYSSSGTDIMPPDTAILITLVANPQKKNRKFWHGLLEADFGNGAFHPTTAFVTAFSAWQAAALGALFTKNKTGSGPPPTFDYSATTSIYNSGVYRNRKVGRPFGTPRGHR